MSTFESPIESRSEHRFTSYLTNHNYFGGWLAVFLVGLLLSNLFTLLMSIPSIISSGAGRFNFWIGLSAANSLAGLLLAPVLLLRWRRCPTVARVYLVSSFLADFFTDLFLQISLTVVFDFLVSYIWLVYFTDSKRVKTYYRNDNSVRA